MTPERFRTLLQAYGAGLQRWPDAERAAARTLAQQRAPELQPLLDEAALLDHWLDSHTVPPPDAALLDRVVAGAAESGRSARRGRRSWWWLGVGLAGIGLAGSLVGALVVSIALRSITPSAVDGPERATAFSALPADWSEE
jgi:hypothetical protein